MKYLKSYKLFESITDDYEMLNQVISVYAFTLITSQQPRRKELTAKLTEFLQEIRDFVRSFDYTDDNLFPDLANALDCLREEFFGVPQSILKDILNRCDKA